ncbi:MAG: hypothetical protein J6I68_04000 [Butyrivibrio sp.]|uniref:hypothetical protein n=1 Tax=Butyrivibrio sp. TaxID=28121 RepID=UPI001B53A53C|nr:hypothetical protein [Butyrivibrio sp.]MBP3782390.1 hypothetical protein [Butyrivibrio sp.]
MKTLTRVSRISIAFAMTIALMMGNILGIASFKAFAASSLYEVTGDYTGDTSLEIPAEGITITQENFKKDLYVIVHFLDSNGAQTSISLTTGRGTDGTLKMSQVSVFKSGDWEKYVNGTDTVSQAAALALYPSITIDESDFATVNGMGTASRTTKNLVVAAFDANGNLYGTFPVSILCTLASQTETVINGLDFETIVTRVNALKDSVDALSGSEYADMKEKITTALNSLDLAGAEIDATSVGAAISSVQTKIDAMNADIDTKTRQVSALATTIAEKTANSEDHSAEDAQKTTLEGEIAVLNSGITELTSIKANLVELQNTVNQLSESDGEVQDTLKSLMEEYNTLYEELDYLRKISASNNAGYAGVVDGQPVVFINGTAFAYDQSSGEEYTYYDDNGDAHPVVKYVGTTDPDYEFGTGSDFEFFVTLGGIHVLDADGSETVYEDTLEVTLFKVDNMLKEISNKLLDAQTELNDFYSAMKDIMGEDYTGTTDAEMLSQIKAYVNDLISSYNDTKDDYVNLVQALKGDLTEEEIDNLSNTNIASEITALKEKTQNVQDSIQKALTGSAVTDENRQTLEQLLANVSSMKSTLETKEAQLQALIDAAGADDAATALTMVKNLVKKADTLESENKALTASNTALKKQAATNTSTSSSATSTALKNLQDKVSSLTNTNSSLKSQLSAATTAANNASNAAKNVSTSGTATSNSSTSNSSTVKALQEKISDLTTQLAKSNSSSASSGKTTATETRAVVEETTEEETEPGFATVEKQDSGVIDGQFDLNGASEDEEDVEETAEPVEEVVPEEGKINWVGVAIAALLLLGLLGGGGFFAYKMFFAKPKPSVDLDELLEDDDFDGEEGFEASGDDGEVAMADEVEIDDSFDEEFDEEITA